MQRNLISEAVFVGFLFFSLLVFLLSFSSYRGSLESWNDDRRASFAHVLSQ